MRLISFSLTTPQFLDGSKTVTRRLNWKRASEGSELAAVKKAMGLKLGEKVERIGKIRLIGWRRERLDLMLTDYEYGLAEVVREGLPQMSPEEFVEFFCRTHTGCSPEREITRMEFVKL